MLLSLFCAFFLTFFSLIRKESYLIALLWGILLWMLWGWNYQNGDFEAYEILYENVVIDWENDKYELGYKLLMLFFRTIGFDFQQFYILLSFFIIFLWVRFFLFFSNYPSFCFCIFFWVFFPLDYVLLRNTLAFAIILQGIKGIICPPYKIIYFIFLVLLATSIHVSSFFYLLFLCACCEYRLNLKKYLFLSLLGACLVLICIPFIVSSIGVITDGNRSEQYASSFGVFIVNSIIQIVNVSICYFFYKQDVSYSLHAICYRNFILNINIVLLFLIIFYAFMGIFVRIFHCVSIINMLYMVNVIFLLKRYSYVSYMNCMILFLLYMISFLRFYLFYFDDTIGALFKYNSIFVSDVI